MGHELPEVHDGDRVREIVEKSGIGFEEFERKMDWNTSKRYRMLRRDSWRAADLLQASLVLGHDFLSVYRTAVDRSSGGTLILVPVRVNFPVDPQLMGLDGLVRYLESLNAKDGH